MAHKRGFFKRDKKGGPHLSQDMKKRLKKERANRPPPSRFQKNVKFVARAQETIQAQKRQLEAEQRYRREANATTFASASSDSEADEPAEDKVTFDDLAHTFGDPTVAGKNAIDSDEESEAVEEEESEGTGDSDCVEMATDDGEVVDGDEENVSEDGSNVAESDPGSEGQTDGSDAAESEQGSDDELPSEDGSDLSSDDENCTTASNDPYMIHTSFNLSPSMMEALVAEPPTIEKKVIPFGNLGTLHTEIPSCAKSKREASGGILPKETYAKPAVLPVVPTPEAPIEWGTLHVKDKLVRNIPDGLDPLQRDLFAVLNNYHDCFYVHNSFEEAERLRYVYCLHTMNHVLKAVTKMQHHTMKLAAEKLLKRTAAKSRRRKKKNEPLPTVMEYRDQGFVRPKVLIIVPFRESALQVVNVLKQLFTGDNEKAVANYKRFTDEYGGGSSLYFPQKYRKPADYERTFAGNIDDNFRLGISINRSSMKLYAKYYSSDVIVASPLGLRLAIGAKGERHRDYDFLSSIELLVIDQADVCYAQNWEHVLHVLEHLHQQPTNTEHTEFSRVREWCLGGHSKFYRQTLLFSAIELPELRSLFNKQLHNYRGKVRSIHHVTTGSIKQVVVPVAQSFQRIETTSLGSEGNARFTHFVNVILPQARTVAMARCLIYVPSYFDFVRLRNYFKKEEISFTQICEYTTDGKIARARDMFFHGGKHFLLYSERAHFFRRHRIKGIRHLIMYGPPVFPQFYPEMVNLMAKENQNRMDGVDDDTMTVTVLYAGFDTYQLAEILGTKGARNIIQAPRSVFRFTTGQK